MSTFYSQCGEDQWISENLKLPPKGVFVDVGAADGVSSSNTKYFEELGWTGVCLEPAPEMFAKCCKARKCPTRQTAIGPRPGMQRFGKGDASGFVGGLNVAGPSIRVWTAPLGALLALERIKEIDLLSIDTEGTELDVWGSFEWKIHRPKIVVIEHQTMDLPSNIEPIRSVFASTGAYREAHSTKYNLIFEAV